jgi:hypothetical protein
MPHNDLHPKEIRNNTNTRSGEKNPPTTKRNGVDKNNRTLRYPYGLLKDNTDYLKIDIAEYVAPGLNLQESAKEELVDKDGRPVTNLDQNARIKSIKPGNFSSFTAKTGTQSNKASLKKPLKTIYLPIPQNLSDTTSVNWDSGGLNALEAFGVTAAGKIMQSGGLMEGANVAKEAVEGLISGAINFSKDPQAKAAITAALAGEAIGALGGNVSGSQLISRATGQVFNPNLELLFEGVNLRSFPFSFEFFPRNLNEAQEVKKIIRSFKTSMSARKTDQSGGIFISAPNIFQLTYMKGNKKHPFLNTFLPMALTSINIAYTGSNTYSTFHDGTPTHIKMELTFKELNPVYFEDYQDLENKGDLSVGY